MHPDPLFTIFGRGVYAYGLLIAVGLIAALGLMYFFWRKTRKFNETSADALIYSIVIAFFVGLLTGALFQAFYNYIENPSAGFKFGSGITFIGGLIGGVLSFVGIWNLYVFVIRPRTKIKFLKKEMNAGVSDALPFIPIGITLAHAFGRLGCLFAGCCYGNPTDAWYGLPCAAGHSGNYVPIQLFEMLFLLVLSGVMALLVLKFKFNYNFSVYAIAYAIWRFIIEYFRSDDRGKFIGSLTPSQFWCIIMVLCGIGYIFLQKYFLSRFMKHPERQAVAATNGSGENNGEPTDGQAEQAPAKTEQPAPPEDLTFVDD
ncbi:MAG: prolipoprotein diacylglyceryl transferase [Clostridiales bacterium]|nr:prolipoprotein diacylglyceryl transferase [Clostridiales bacterium]